MAFQEENKAFAVFISCLCASVAPSDRDPMLCFALNVPKVQAPSNAAPTVFPGAIVSECQLRCAAVSRGCHRNGDLVTESSREQVRVKVQTLRGSGNRGSLRGFDPAVFRRTGLSICGQLSCQRDSQKKQSGKVLKWFHDGHGSAVKFLPDYYGTGQFGMLIEPSEGTATTLVSG